MIPLDNAYPKLKLDIQQQALDKHVKEFVIRFLEKCEVEFGFKSGMQCDFPEEQQAKTFLGRQYLFLHWLLYKENRHDSNTIS